MYAFAFIIQNEFMYTSFQTFIVLKQHLPRFNGKASVNPLSAEGQPYLKKYVTFNDDLNSI